MSLHVLAIRVLIGKCSRTGRTLIGFHLEMQGFYVLSQVVLGTEVLAAGITAGIVHCLIYNAKGKIFADYCLFIGSVI